MALLEANWRETPVVHLKAGASTIITWNVRHFAAAAPEIGIEAPP
ncbi:hypothetical protein [Candidatus Palauibacter sp.]